MLNPREFVHKLRLMLYQDVYNRSLYKDENFKTDREWIWYLRGMDDMRNVICEDLGYPLFDDDDFMGCYGCNA